MLQKRSIVNCLPITLFFTTMVSYVTTSCNGYTEYTRRCQHLSSYDSYQWVTCYPNNYIKALGANHSRGCFDDTIPHCYYPCQAERHEQFYGGVSSDCQCAPWSPYPACNSLRKGGKICRSISGYFGFQYMTCMDNKEIKRKTHNTFICKSDYCWLQCEHENNGKINGDVSAGCSCHYSHSTSTVAEHKMHRWIVFILAILSWCFAILNVLGS